MFESRPGIDAEGAKQEPEKDSADSAVPLRLSILERRQIRAAMRTKYRGNAHGLGAKWAVPHAASRHNHSHGLPRPKYISALQNRHRSEGSDGPAEFSPLGMPRVSRALDPSGYLESLWDAGPLAASGPFAGREATISALLLSASGRNQKIGSGVWLSGTRQSRVGKTTFTGSLSMSGRRLHGWARIGIVLSIVWAIMG